MCVHGCGCCAKGRTLGWGSTTCVWVLNLAPKSCLVFSTFWTLETRDLIWFAWGLFDLGLVARSRAASRKRTVEVEGVGTMTKEFKAALTRLGFGAGFLFVALHIIHLVLYL